MQTYPTNDGITMIVAGCAGTSSPQRPIGWIYSTRIKEEMLPFATLLGIEFSSASTDRIVARMTVREDLCTRPAVLHGGAVMAFADTLGATGTIVNLADGCDDHDDREQDELHRSSAGRDAGDRGSDTHSPRPADHDLADAGDDPRGPPDRGRHPDPADPLSQACYGKSRAVDVAKFVQLGCARNRIIPPSDGGNATAVPPAIAW